jgi:glyoxylase-like metal-dependent hydrolase (beta-lactamase superfamily II)
VRKPTRSREVGRGERVIPGIWRLRLPLPWPGVPHCNAWALAAGDGIVLVDCGMHEPGSMAHLERALDQAGLRVEHVRLLVCTHAHVDHCGQAPPIADRTGCELWMHPNHGHYTEAADDPEQALARRAEVARQSGVPEDIVRQYESRRGQPIGVDRVVLPDRELLPGVEVETDLGTWQVHETPGHAPSHVCLHQAERDLLISGDHLLGRVSLYYDWGYTPDPAGEFLSSLDLVGELDARLCLAGHARPFRDVRAHIEANRKAVRERIERVRGALADGAKTAFEIVPALVGTDEITPMLLNWGLNESLCYLRYLELRDGVRKVEDGASEGDAPDRWELAA